MKLVRSRKTVEPFFKIMYFYFMCTGVLACMDVCVKAVGFPGTGVAESCELPSGRWEWSPVLWKTSQ